MDSNISSQRSAMYKALAMGGTTNWASDLESYNDAPNTAKSWHSLKLNIKAGVDPYAEGDRHGNWTNISCDDPAVLNTMGLTPQERWGMLDAADAWSDAMNVYSEIDGPRGISFSTSVSNTIHGPEVGQCDRMIASNCAQTLQCSGFQGGGSGATGYEIWNSMVVINEVRRG